MGAIPEQTSRPYERWVQSFNQRDWDSYEEFLAEDVEVHCNSGKCRGIEAVIETERRLTDTHPDAYIFVDEVHVDQPRFTLRVAVDSSAGISVSDDVFKLEGVVHGRIENGEITEMWMLSE